MHDGWIVACGTIKSLKEGSKLARSAIIVKVEASQPLMNSVLKDSGDNDGGSGYAKLLRVVAFVLLLTNTLGCQIALHHQKNLSLDCT